MTSLDIHLSETSILIFSLRITVIMLSVLEPPQHKSLCNKSVALNVKQDLRDISDRIF